MGSIRDNVIERYEISVQEERRLRQDTALNFPDYEKTLINLIALYRKELINEANSVYYIDLKKIDKLSTTIQSLESLSKYKQL